MSGNAVILAAVVSPHPQDRTRNTIYIADTSLGLGVDNYLKPTPAHPRRLRRQDDRLSGDRRRDTRGGARDGAESARTRDARGEEEADAAGEA